MIVCAFVKSNICSGRNCVYMHKQVSKTPIWEKKKKQFCSNIPKIYQPIRHHASSEQSSQVRKKNKQWSPNPQLTSNGVAPLQIQSAMFLLKNLPTTGKWSFSKPIYMLDFTLALTSRALYLCCCWCKSPTSFLTESRTAEFHLENFTVLRSTKFCCRTTSWLICLAQFWWKQAEL